VAVSFIGETRENQQPVASHSQTLSRNDNVSIWFGVKILDSI
jgi:hypothetical protein